MIARSRGSLAVGVLAVGALGLVASGCSGDGGAEGVASLERDALALQEVLATDPARAVLREIEQAVDTERPVMAAEMIDRGGLPAVHRQIERFQQATMTTREGRALRTRAVRIHRARAAALELYRDALARGIGTEDESLLVAMRSYAEAEIDIVQLYDDLAVIRPLDPETPGRVDREVRLGGLPPIRREGEPDEAPTRAEPDVTDLRAGEPQEPLPE
ncbi:MAG: hypothetical protein M3Y87_26365 [Myxococcota bacterium]|nr:hypothetical protein [Myxococcota bacterium]